MSETKFENESDEAEEEEILETPETPETSETPEMKKKEVSLQLGDVVNIMDYEDEKLNNQTFMIEYIDKSKIILLNTATFEKYELKIHENGTLGNGTIQEIRILWRSNKPGYANQNNLLPGTWLNLYFGGDIPTIITGKITNLEDDMIEITTYPDKEVIYINFEYKGIPEYLPIQAIEIRQPPEKRETASEEEKGEYAEEKVETKDEYGVEERKEEKEEFLENLSPEQIAADRETALEMEDDARFVPSEKINNQLREFILQADEIQFGIGEELGEITQYVDIGKRQQRYDVQAQANDLLDEMLSTIPNSERTTRVLQNIHTMIERFKQLRMQFSTFDDYGNINGPTFKTATWKPLLHELLKFNKLLYWIIPVVKNVKKIYDQGASSYSDTDNLSTVDTLLEMNNLLQNYKSNNSSEEQNKYVSLVKELNTFFTPFSSVDPENMSDIIYEKQVGENLNVVLDNLSDFYSTVVNNDRVKSQRFVIQKYNLGLTRLVATQFTGSKMIAQRVVLTQPDEMSIKSILTMREPAVRFSRINLPGTSILDRANLNDSFLQYWQLLNSKTNVKNVMIDEFDFEKEKGKFSKQREKDKETIPEYILEEYYVDDEDLEEGEERELKQRMVKNPKFIEKTEEENNAKLQEQDAFLKNVTNYLLIEPESEENGAYKKEELYEKFLESVVPKTSVLFKLVKKYIVDKVSIVDAVAYMEPFLVYTDDLTYMQYKDIVQFLDSSISSYNKNFVEKSRAFNSVKNIWNVKKQSSFVNAIYNNIRENAEQIMDIDYRCGIQNSNGEILTKMLEKDAGRLYNSAIAYQNIFLMFHDSMRAILNQEKQQYENRSDEDKAKDQCTTYVLAKQYSSEEEMAADNGIQTPIYFDKKFDKTNYSILDDYTREMSTMEPDAFVDFVVEKLQKKMKLTQGEAEYLVDTLISGVKEVIDGQYAFMYNISAADNSSNITYYKRINGEWVPDDSVDKTFFVTDDNILCNIKRDCIDTADKCISTDLNKTSLVSQTLSNVLNEFDVKYTESKEDLEKQIGNEFKYNKAIIERIGKIEFERKFQYNNEQFLIGTNLSAYQSEKEALIKVSPFQKLRDMILGQSDFVKKQNDIIQFAMKFTREAFMSGNGAEMGEESIHWRYCVKTNVPLLPAFLYSLASVFVNNRNNYLTEVDRIIKDIGKMSDDGDAYVDENSGYVIRKIDFDTEEGYEESGFKMKSRDLIEQDFIAPSQKNTSAPKIETPEIRACSNIITALSSYMGIQMDDQREFIIQNVTTSFKENIPSEKTYKEQLEIASKKGRTIQSYKELYNSTLLYMTLAMFLIGVQTSIPSIKTRKTFPGCVRSFKGYPFQGAGDDSAVNYVACVAYKIRSAVEPWNVLMKKKESFIADKIKFYIENFFSDRNNPVIDRKFKEKAEYLKTLPMDIMIPENHDIKNWIQFLPPLQSFNIPKVTNISPEFKAKLLRDLKNGISSQRENILIVESKIILFSLALQECIQKIIQKKQPILTNVNNQAFIENACCNEKAVSDNEEYSVIDYFIRENPEIASYNTVVGQLTNMLLDIHSITASPFLFSRENDKNIYPAVTNDFNESTIYRAFIVYCNFTNLLPISEDLIPVCSDKPSFILANDTINDIIKKLKDDGRNYTNASLLRLLQIVGRDRIVPLQIDFPEPSPVEVMKDVLEDVEKEEILTKKRKTATGTATGTGTSKTKDEGQDKDTDFEFLEKMRQVEQVETANNDMIRPELRNMLLNNINSFNLSLEVDTAELREMKNHLAKENVSMKRQIIEFIRQHNGVDRKLKNIDKMLSDLTTWNGIKFGEDLENDPTIQRSPYEIKKDRKISDDTGIIA